MRDREAELEIKSGNFNLKQIAESGQCFRMNEIEKGRYGLIAYDRYIELIQTGVDDITICASKGEDISLWETYFDLDYDYKSVVDRLIFGEDDFLRKSACFGDGLRILRQEPFEILISFIISQNKNIPAIKSTIEKLCLNYGTEKLCLDDPQRSYFTFPTAESLANAGKDELRSMGLGYRDKYVHGAAVAVAEGRLDLDYLQNLQCDELMAELMKIKGIGKKVASCVALFGFHKLEAVPVDVWIARIDKDIYDGKFQWDKYGDVAGLVQQYMFYYIRNCVQ